MCTVQYCVPQESGVDRQEDDIWEQQVDFPSILLSRVREYARAVRHSHELRKVKCEEGTGFLAFWLWSSSHSHVISQVINHW